MKVLSLNTSQPENLMDNHGNDFISSVRKKPTSTTLLLTKLGFEGDSVVDEAHGGEHMAVHAYSHDHYEFFNKKNGSPLPVPAFGENLTITNLKETDVNVGDIWRLGEALVQISQPTERCRTMGRALHQSKLLKWIHEEMMTGFYLRVLEEGRVSSESNIEVLEKGPEILNIAHLNRVLFKLPKVMQPLEEICSYPELSPRWKKSAMKQFQQKT